MDAATQRVIERLHAGPTMAVLAVAGAGAQAVSWLLRVPGASRTVLEAVTPYASPSFIEYLGHAPDQFVSAQTATDMAHVAYRRAVHLREGDNPVVGVACTATIATDREKRGEHRCHVAAWSQDGVSTYSLGLTKGLRDRAGEDTVVSRLVLRALACASHVESETPLGLDDSEEIQAGRIRYEDPIKAFLAGHVSTVTVHPDGGMAADRAVHGGVLSGSFHPLHEGHERLAGVASGILDSEVTFELSVTNVDKPPLEEDEIRRRAAQFAARKPLVLTRVPVFFEKARLFPGCTFVVGSDTVERLFDPRYYDGDEPGMLSALEVIREQGCRFLVAGRVSGETFRTLDEVRVPEAFRDMFTPIAESDFRSDLSSTKLRLVGHGP